MPRPLSANPRTAQLNLRFTPAEHAALSARAAANGMLLSSWACRILLSAGANPAASRCAERPLLRATRLPAELLVALRTTGLRLNAAAHLINGIDNHVPPALSQALADLDALLLPIRDQLAEPSHPLDHDSHYQIKKVAVNLTQIERRLQRQSIPSPPLLDSWSAHLRRAVNNEVRPP